MDRWITLDYLFILFYFFWEYVETCFFLQRSENCNLFLMSMSRRRFSNQECNCACQSNLALNWLMISLTILMICQVIFCPFALSILLSHLSSISLTILQTLRTDTWKHSLYCTHKRSKATLRWKQGIIFFGILQQIHLFCQQKSVSSVLHRPLSRIHIWAGFLPAIFKMRWHLTVQTWGAFWAKNASHTPRIFLWSKGKVPGWMPGENYSSLLSRSLIIWLFHSRLATQCEIWCARKTSLFFEQCMSSLTTHRSSTLGHSSWFPAFLWKREVFLVW